MENIIIPDHIKKLLKPEGYFERFYEFTNEFHTHEEAFEATEHQLKTNFGINRYKNYDSFKDAKSKFMKSKKTK